MFGEGGSLSIGSSTAPPSGKMSDVARDYGQGV
jgi:hypothetical protein